MACLLHVYDQLSAEQNSYLTVVGLNKIFFGLVGFDEEVKNVMESSYFS